MENDNAPYTQPETPAIMPIAIRYGLITGLLMVIYYLIVFFTGTFGNWFVGILSLIILIVAIVMAHNHYKKLNGGFMKYGKGLWLGTLLAGISGILTGLFVFIYMSYIDPSVLDSLKEAQLAMMENFNMPEEQMDKMIEKIDAENTPARNLINQILGGVIMGFILSLIIAAITKRNRPEFE